MVVKGSRKQQTLVRKSDLPRGLISGAVHTGSVLITAPVAYASTGLAEASEDSSPLLQQDVNQTFHSEYQPDQKESLNQTEWGLCKHNSATVI